jgi:hypothetical protein
MTERPSQVEFHPTGRKAAANPPNLPNSASSRSAVGVGGGEVWGTLITKSIPGDIGEPRGVDTGLGGDLPRESRRLLLVGGRGRGRTLGLLAEGRPLVPSEAALLRGLLAGRVGRRDGGRPGRGRRLLDALELPLLGLGLLHPQADLRPTSCRGLSRYVADFSRLLGCRGYQAGCQRADFRRDRHLLLARSISLARPDTMRSRPPSAWPSVAAPTDGDEDDDDDVDDDDGDDDGQADREHATWERSLDRKSTVGSNVWPCIRAALGASQHLVFSQHLALNPN